MIVGLVGSSIRPHPQDASEDDDRCWFLGFYNNPADPSLFVTNRIFRWHRQVNIGNPLGLVFTILVLLMFVGLDVLAAVSSHL